MLYDYCPGTTLQLKQAPDMFRMNTDSYMLGRFMHIKENQVVLDVGTNNGVLLLYASLHNPRELIGIDIQEEALEYAEFNLSLNDITGSLAHTSLQEYTGTIDVIICNPPYFKGEHKKENLSLRKARHEEYLPMEELFAHSSRLLNSKGSLQLIYPAMYLEELILLGNKYGFSMKRMKLSYKKSKQKAHTVCAEFVLDAKKHVEIEMYEEIA